MKRLLVFIISVLSLVLLSSCTQPTEGAELVRVMVTECEGITVLGENPKDVPIGSDVTFDIKINDGYAYDGVSVGEYDRDSGKLTLKNVTRRTVVKFEIANVGYDSSVKYVYIFNGQSGVDTTSVSSGGQINAGTLITVTAGANDRRFVGWSFGKTYESGGDIVSYDRTFSFRLSPEITDGGSLFVYPNYTDSNVFYYDAAGGDINADSFNLASNNYYTAEIEDNRIKITLLEKYFSYAECASLFFDDGTFSRPGYVLKEYNTKPDGSGEGYSLGSKYFPGDGEPIYCIWESAAPKDELLYRDVNMPRPDGKDYLDRWYESGVEIYGYLGDEDSVAIPEEIDGKKVVSIAKNTFVEESFAELTLPKTLQRISDGAFVGCNALKTLYYPNGIYEVSDAIFDEATYENFTRLIVNATVAPRNTTSTDGGFAVKLSRVIANRDDKLIIVISGSSSFQGLSSAYMEALFDGEYTVVNFGTTRPRPGTFYLEALSYYTSEDDIFVFAPENTAYMMGEDTLNWRFIYDLEGMNNLFRYVDISNYKNYFNAFRDLNNGTVSDGGEFQHGPIYTKPQKRYEQICENGYPSKGIMTDKYGDYQHTSRQGYVGIKQYVDTYFVTLNKYVKSINDYLWNDVENQVANKDYTDPNNITWTNIDRPELVEHMNMSIGKAQASGAKVYFGFAPVDADKLVPEAKNREWLLAYDKLIEELYIFDGNLGSCVDYIYNHEYAYDCAFHVNDYGRTYRTYQMYTDIAEKLGLESVKSIYSVGTDFAGCLFEEGSDGKPVLGVDYLD